MNSSRSCMAEKWGGMARPMPFLCGCLEEGLAGLLGTYRSQFLGREDAIDVENHDELRVALAHAADKVGADVGAYARRGFNLLGFEIDHFLHRVRQGPDHDGLVLEHHFYNYDAGVARVFRFRHSET